MAAERLWCVVLPEEVYESGDRPDAVWKRYIDFPEKLEPGEKDLTIPDLSNKFTTMVTVDNNFHGVHSITAVEPNPIAIRVSVGNVEGGIHKTRIPEDSAVFNMIDGSNRLRYMLRWLESPTQGLFIPQVEQVGAGIGSRDLQPPTRTGLNEEGLRKLFEPRRVPVGA